jgi:Flp pilus assembly protein TadD
MFLTGAVLALPALGKLLLGRVAAAMLLWSHPAVLCPPVNRPHTTPPLPPAGKALEANPTDPAVLLSLGVSHTNELDQAEAVGYLSRWLAAHPDYASASVAAGPPPDSSQLLSHTLRIFSSLAATHKGDAEVAIATGVLQHLARDYDGAIRSFRAALELAPSDYSLWNKLGATLANHSHSADAIGAYQRALDLKVGAEPGGGEWGGWG